MADITISIPNTKGKKYADAIRKVRIINQELTDLQVVEQHIQDIVKGDYYKKVNELAKEKAVEALPEEKL